MSYMFLFLMGILVLVPVCFIGAFILCFFVFLFPVLIKRLRNKTAGDLKISRRIILSLLLSLLSAIVIPACLILLGGGLLWMDSAGPKEYWSYSGDYDYFRMPLEPPYELVMVDTIDYAAIQLWQDSSSSIISGITAFEKRGLLMFGETSRQRFASERIPQDKEWFIFDLSTGVTILFQNEEEFIAALREKGMVDIQLKTVLQNWNEYWDIPE